MPCRAPEGMTCGSVRKKEQYRYALYFFLKLRLFFSQRRERKTTNVLILSHSRVRLSLSLSSSPSLLWQSLAGRAAARHPPPPATANGSQTAPSLTVNTDGKQTSGKLRLQSPASRTLPYCRLHAVAQGARCSLSVKEKPPLPIQRKRGKRRRTSTRVFVSCLSPLSTAAAVFLTAQREEKRREEKKSDPGGAACRSTDRPYAPSSDPVKKTLRLSRLFFFSSHFLSLLSSGKAGAPRRRRAWAWAWARAWARWRPRARELSSAAGQQRAGGAAEAKQLGVPLQPGSHRH